MKTIDIDIRVTYSVTQQITVSDDMYLRLKGVYECHNGVVNPQDLHQSEIADLLSEVIDPASRYSTRFELLGLEEEYAGE